MRMLLLLAVSFLAPAGARAWPVALGTREPSRLAVDARGNLLAGMPVSLPDNNGTYDVEQIDRAGHRRWRHRIDGTGREQSTEVGALVPTADGDAIAVGNVVDADGGTFVVVRLAGSNGHERWRSRLKGRQPHAGYIRGRTGAVDASGAVIVAGTVENAPEANSEYGDFTVAKLDGRTGQELWRFTLDAPPGEQNAWVVAVDGAGDVIAAGDADSGGASTVPVVKLAGGTGQMLWRRDLDFAWRTMAIALDPAGNALLAVSTTEPHGNAFAVVKLAGDTGDILWVARESGSEGRWQEATRVLVDPSGAVFASGMTDDGAGPAGSSFGETFTVTRLDSATGAHVWDYRTAGTSGGGFATELRSGPPGLLIAAGTTASVTTCADDLVVALDTRTGTPVWAHTFDGTLVARHGCIGEDSEGPVPGPPADNDDLGAMTTDARGRVFAGIWLVNRTRGRVRVAGSIQRLVVRP